MYMQYTPFYLNKTDSIFQINPKYTLDKYFTMVKDRLEPMQDVVVDQNYRQTAFFISKSQDAYEVVTIVPKSMA